MVTRLREEMSRGRSASSASRACQREGTAAAWVGRTVSIIAASGPGWRWRSGSSRLAPDISAACGSPQALTWNIGTTGRVVSAAVRAMASAMLTCMECR
jgi:hypothetical protein